MKRTTLYLDTSVINFLFAEDAPDKKEITIELFECYVKTGIYDAYISQLVIDEIKRTDVPSHRDQLLAAIEKYFLNYLDFENDYEEISRLADQYIVAKILSRNQIDDATHISIATVKELDILLSWNFRHMANVNKEAKIQAINRMEGYTKPLKIITPFEVIYHE
ncbi:MAG: hypothetical protein C4527_04100 [Candidatus Omnitrophota bacterium]|jgi:hypothetical protein|nr:MAG: hypothetical protein C4527_04100 [Candidatus Omnitrophota bacterium]